MSSKKNKSKKKTPSKSPSKGKSQPTKKKQPSKKKKKKMVRNFKCWSLNPDCYIDLWMGPGAIGNVEEFSGEEIVVSLLDSQQRPIKNDDNEILSYVGGKFGWIDTYDFYEELTEL